MTNTMKGLIALVVAVLFLGSVAYFKLANPGADDQFSTSTTTTSGGDESVDSLLSSFDQDNIEEGSLLTGEDTVISTTSDESALVGEINQTYQNEL
jgi:hypothetical protein